MSDVSYAVRQCDAANVWSRGHNSLSAARDRAREFASAGNEAEIREIGPHSVGVLGCIERWKPGPDGPIGPIDCEEARG